MKATVFGAGKIARGFIGQLLEINDYYTYYVDNNAELVKLLNKKASFNVHIMGDESKSTTVKNYTAFHTNELSEINNAINASDVAFVSVGGKGLQSVGAMLGDIFNEYGVPEKSITFITCENVKNAAKSLSNSMLEVLNKDLIEDFKERIGVTESVVMRTATIPSEALEKQEPLGIWVQNYWYLPVNGENYKGVKPNIKEIELINNFGNLLTQKMYTNNTSNAIIAYNAYVYGYDILHEAALSPEISDILDRAYPEINEILITSLGIDRKTQEEFSKNARLKYEDSVIVDRIERHCKDPIRKLGPEERLLGPAIMAMENNIIPHTIIDAIAKAIFYYHPNDNESMTLKKMREDNGVSYVIENICKVPKDNDLHSLIIKRVAVLMDKGVLKNV